MCLQYIYPKTHRGFEIAQEPIKVYKVMLRNPNETEPYYEFPIMDGGASVGDTVKAKVEAEPHTEPHWCNPDYLMATIEGEGVHAFTTLARARRSSFNCDVITEWEIPAGTKYWEDTFCSEIAATEMKFLGVVEPSKYARAYLNY